MKNKIALSLLLLLLSFQSFAKSYELLNVSYDPTRELYEEYNNEFSKYYETKTGDTVSIKQSHGGSGKQGRSIIDGLNADVATLALSYDIDVLSEKAGLLPKNWQTSLPNNSTPYYSTIVFLVRKNNPKNIKDWGDLVKPGVGVITPNPKTSGGARWNYLALLGYARENKLNEKEFLKNVYKNVPILDTGARGSTITFAQRHIGDVLLSWENEAYLVKKQFPEYEIITPSFSVLAAPSVAVVSKNADKNGNANIAKEYLEHLYSKKGQNIIAKNFYRPFDEEIFSKYKNQFPPIKLIDINSFGGWNKVQKEHFSDGGVFDLIYNK